MIELANRIDKNATAWISQYGIPRVNRMYGIADDGDDEESTTPLIQGYTPVVFCADVDGRGREFCCPGIGDNRPRDAYRTPGLAQPTRGLCPS